IGTDTYPHNMLEEMRHALYASRIVARDVFDLRTRDIFNAATLGGAAALQRDDIGRLAVGAKADLVLVDVTAPSMRPLRAPTEGRVGGAAAGAVRQVFVGGAAVVIDGRVTTMDYASAARELEEAQRRVEPMVRELDWAHRSHEELSPLVFRRTQ